MAAAAARMASRESATRLGWPVEPEVRTCNGSAVVAWCQSVSCAWISAALPETGQRLLTRPTLPTSADVWAPCHNQRVATAAQWIEGARPRTLPAAIAPVLAGTGIAVFEGEPVWWKAALALLVALFLQIGVNYANDYSDGIRGTDQDRVGPMRLVGSGAASAKSVKLAALATLGLAGVFGLALAATTAWWLVAVGAVCILAAWYYTGGSKPYGYLGLGEVMVFIFFGLVAVLGTTYVQTLTFEQGSLFAAIGIGSLACAILVANNLRDIPTDITAGKRTLAVVLGDDRTRQLFVLLQRGAMLMLIGVAVTTSRWSLLALVAVVPMVLSNLRVQRGANGPELIPVLKLAGITELLYGLGIFVGCALAVVLS